MFSSNITLEEFVLRSLRASPLTKPFLTPAGWQLLEFVYWNVSVGLVICAHVENGFFLESLSLIDCYVQESCFCLWDFSGKLYGRVVQICLLNEMLYFFFFCIPQAKYVVNKDIKTEVFRHFLRTANVKKSRDQCVGVRFAVWGSRLYGLTTLWR